MAGEIQLNSTTFATESAGTITVSNVDSATNRQNLGLEIGVDVQSYDADTTKNDVANTFTANQIISVTDNTNAALQVTQLGTGNALVINGRIQGTSSAGGSLGQFGSINTNYNSGNNNWRFGMNTLGAFSIFIDPAVSGNTGVYLDPGATSWSSSSDERLKDISGNIENAIESVQSLRAVKYTLKADNAEIKTQRVGLIAQDVQSVLPEIVDEYENDYLGIRYTEIIPLLVAAIKEQQTIIESQQSQIDALTARIEALETT